MKNTRRFRSSSCLSLMSLAIDLGRSFLLSVSVGLVAVDAPSANPSHRGTPSSLAYWPASFHFARGCCCCCRCCCAMQEQESKHEPRTRYVFVQRVLPCSPKRKKKKEFISARVATLSRHVPATSYRLARLPVCAFVAFLPWSHNNDTPPPALTSKSPVSLLSLSLNTTALVLFLLFWPTVRATGFEQFCFLPPPRFCSLSSFFG